MNTNFVLRSFGDDIQNFELRFELESLQAVRQEVRKYFKELGWQVKFSGADRVYLMRGKQRRHLFLQQSAIVPCDCGHCERHSEKPLN